MTNTTAPGRPEADADEFEAAFAQAGNELSASRAPAAQEQQPESQSEHEAGEQVEQAGAPAADDAAPAERAEAQAAKPQDQQAQPSGQSVKELEQALAEALHRERSVANRISVADKRSNELQRENAELKRQLDELRKTPVAAATAAAQNFDDALAQSPELAEAVQRRIQAANVELAAKLDAANSRLAELGEAAERTASQVEPVVKQQAMQAVTQVHQALDARFGQAWRDDIRSVPFKAWLVQQSDAIKDIYQNSVSARDTAAVLDLFYAGRRGTSPQNQTQQPAAATTQAAARTTNPQDRLRAASGIAPSGGSAPIRPDPNDFDAAFAEASQQIRSSKKD